LAGDGKDGANNTPNATVGSGGGGGCTAIHQRENSPHEILKIIIEINPRAENITTFRA